MGFYIRWNTCSYGISVAPQHCCLVAFCQPQRHDSVPAVLGGVHPKSGNLRGPQKDSLFLPCVDSQELSPDILGFGALSLKPSDTRAPILVGLQYEKPMAPT